MRMKLSEMALIAEVIGAFAVVISLIYVGIQVNDSASAVRAASANDANTTLQNFYLEVGSDRETSEIFYTALVSPVPLEPTEEFQFLMMLHAAFLAFQNSYFLAKEGTIDEDLHEAITAALVGVRETPGVKRYWRQRRSYLHPEFAQYVDDLIVRESDVTVDIYRPENVKPPEE